MTSSALAVHKAYLRLREIIPGALNTPFAPSAEQIWQTTEQAAEYLVEEYSKLRAQLDAMRKALEQTEDLIEFQQDALWQINQWSQDYPLEIFPEPDLKRAHEVLVTAGMGIDGILASAMRHVIKGVGEIARAALPTSPSEGDAGSG